MILKPATGVAIDHRHSCFEDNGGQLVSMRMSIGLTELATEVNLVSFLEDSSTVAPRPIHYCNSVGDKHHTHLFT